MAVQSPATQDLIRTGRPTNDELEARSPAGRAMHDLEGEMFGISGICVSGRGRQPIWQAADALADEATRRTEAVARAMLAHPDPTVQAWAVQLVGHCADYWRADKAEDAVTGWVFGALVSIHEISRRVAGWAEWVCETVRRAVR